MNRSSAYAISAAMIALLASVQGAAGAKVDVRRNLVYVERKSGPLGMDVYMPAGTGPFPGVLVVHGGGWTMGSRAQLAAVAMTLAERGYTAAAISYRLAPEYRFPAQLHDCQAAVRWLRAHAVELKIDPARIGGYGYSAGGQLVALLGVLDDDDLREEGVPEDASSARLQAVVAGGAPCDFRVLAADNNRLAYWLGGSRAAKPNAYREASPAAFVTGDDPPMFFFHGERDALVPIRSPQRMVELLTSSGVTAEMYTVAGRGHLAAVFDGGALERALAFADRHLKGAASGKQASASAEGPAARAKGGASDGE
jgi:acetyl esterase/lipase